MTLSRLPSPRFDVQAQTQLRGGSKTVLANQIRQDMWRALQNLRGFSPVVRIETTTDAGLLVTAGGQFAAARFPKNWAEDRIADVLSDPDNRSRWVWHANRKGRKIG